MNAQTIEGWVIGITILYGTVFLFGGLLKWLASRSDDWTDIGSTMIYWDDRVKGEAIAVVIVFSLAVTTLILREYAHKLRLSQCVAAWKHKFTQFALHRNQAILAAGLLPVVGRLALLSAVPIPQPYIPDEFSHLLLAGTFACGRITNPTHPMWRYFETLYVFHQPTYTSPYPIAQGLLMALPSALGAHPWLGVCAGMGLMCGVLCWMLQAWLPPQWALFGALLAGARWSIATYWMNSYWGGAAAAIGGALLLGALPRLFRRASARHALLAVLGIAILSQSRPFEGALLALPVVAVLVYRFAGKAQRSIRVLAVLAGGLAVTGAGTLYYNWRVTGNPWLWPYQWHQRVYGTPQNLLDGAPVLAAPRAAVQQDIAETFQWQLGLFRAQSSWQGRVKALPEKAEDFWDFYLEPILSLPLLFLPLAFGLVKVRLLISLGSFVLLGGFLLYPFFFPHYAAPIFGLFLVLLLEGVRAMRSLRWRGKRLGGALFGWWVVAGAGSCLSLIAGTGLAPDLVVHSVTERSRLEQELVHRGGKHLVLVKYTAAHDYRHPWVYNSADIDRSPVVWARALEPSKMAPLLRYYADRKVWLVDAGADDDPAALVPYPPPVLWPHPVVDGRRPYRRQ